MNTTMTRAERTSILGALSSADEEVRRLAVEQLLLFPVEEASERLRECLGDTSWRVRKAAVERIVARAAEPIFQEMLMGSLADGEDPGRRNSAFEALVGCGSLVTDRLIREVSSPDADVRKLAIDALASIQDPSSCDSLVGAIEDSDSNVRAAAIEALGFVGGHAQIDRLMKAACDRDEEVLVRLSALRALSHMEASVGVASLADALDHSLLRPAAFELLGHAVDSDAVDALVKGLSLSAWSSRERAMAALLRTLGCLDGAEAEALRQRLRAVARAEEDLVQASCERLEGADLATRLVVVQFLGLLEDARAVLPILIVGRDEAIEELADATLESLGALVPEALAGVWEDLDSGLKARACTILGKVGGEPAERLLAETVSSVDGEVRCRAASALAEGEFFDRVPDLVRCLETAAQNQDLEGRDEVTTIVAAIVRLAERSEASEAGVDAQLIELLSSRLGGASEPVRLAIAQVLACVGREQDEDVIDFLMKDESWEVRRAAVRALGRFAFEHARDAIRLSLADESSLVRIEAAKLLGESGHLEAFDELRGLLADEDARVVSVAIRSVGRLYRDAGEMSDEIAGVIAAALQAEPDVALAAFDALRELGGERAGRLAAAALHRPEPDLLRSAVARIGEFGSEVELTETIPLVAHGDWSVRAEAARALSERGHRKSLPAMLRRLDVEDDAFVREAILSAIGRLEE